MKFGRRRREKKKKEGKRHKKGKTKRHMRKKKVEGHNDKCKSKEKRRMERRQMVTEEHRKITIMSTKKMTCKGIMRQVFIRVYRLETFLRTISRVGIFNPA
jgi:hypothetical protein